MNILKGNFKRGYALSLILFLFWLLLTLDFSLLNIFAGIFISLFTTEASYGILYDKKGFKFKFPKLTILIKYFFKLIIEIYKSSFYHVLRIIKKDYNPTIIKVNLEVTDPLVITIISNSITLTPGTITVDTDKNKLTVLSILDYGDNGKRVINNIKNNFEKFFVTKRDSVEGEN